MLAVPTALPAAADGMAVSAAATKVDDVAAVAIAASIYFGGV